MSNLQRLWSHILGDIKEIVLIQANSVCERGLNYAEVKMTKHLSSTVKESPHAEPPLRLNMWMLNDRFIKPRASSKIMMFSPAILSDSTWEP